MIILRRAILFLLLIFLLLTVATPGLVYIVGLYRVDGRPTPANPKEYSEATINSAWTKCKEELPVYVEATNPWAFTIKFFFGEPLKTTPGERAAWRIASSHNITHRVGNNTWWHTSGAALTIWLTRHWSSQQIGATLVRDNLCR